MSCSPALSLGLPISMLAVSCGPPLEPTSPASAEKQAAHAAGTSTPRLAEAPACDEHSGACGESAGTKRISISGATACAVVSGRVACWGDNSGRVIAAGSKGPRPTPEIVQGIERAVAVHVGRSFGCAVTSEGKLFCFHAGRAREIAQLSEVTDAAIWDHMVIAVKKGGSLAAAVLSSDAGNAVPVVVPRLGDVVAVSAGLHHACVLRKSGGVMCWGDPRYTGSGVDVDTMDVTHYQALMGAAVNVRGLADAVQVSVGDTHTCAVSRTKRVACWGLNWSGGLGDGSAGDQYAAVAVQDIDDAESVATGYHHTCVRRVSGSVSCFGENHAGQIGSATFGVKGAIQVQGITGAVAVAAGDEVSCAALSGGSVSCWGSAARGRLGNGAVAEHVMPRPVKGVTGVKTLGVAHHVSCALDSRLQLTCWGLGHERQVGDQKSGETPMAAHELGDVDGVFAAEESLCLINRARSAFCRRLQPAPTLVRLGVVKEVFDHGVFGTALLPSGQVMLWRSAWGSEGAKQGSVWTRNITGLSDAVAIASYDGTSCAVRQSGKVACVGFDSFRTLGPQGSVKPTSPVEVPGVSDAVAIAQGGDQMCLLHKTGEVTCFRSSRVPRPFDPKQPVAKERKPLPIELEAVGGLTGVVQLSMAGLVRCALLKDATVSCWGADNSYGQLGTGDFDVRSGPVAVAGLTNVARIAAGAYHVCAAMKNGEVMCWGRNTSGEVGQSAQPYMPGPVSVLLPGAP